MAEISAVCRMTANTGLTFPLSFRLLHWTKGSLFCRPPLSPFPRAQRQRVGGRRSAERNEQKSREFVAALAGAVREERSLGRCFENGAVTGVFFTAADAGILACTSRHHGDSLRVLRVFGEFPIAAIIGNDLVPVGV